MTTLPRRRDRRRSRTSQLIRQAAREVMFEKGFGATSIQDITERANINRVTFYAHFEDKYALVEAIVREKFQNHLVKTLPPVA